MAGRAGAQGRESGVCDACAWHHCSLPVSWQPRRPSHHHHPHPHPHAHPHAHPHPHHHHHPHMHTRTRAHPHLPRCWPVVLLHLDAQAAGGLLHRAREHLCVWGGCVGVWAVARRGDLRARAACRVTRTRGQAAQLGTQALSAATTARTTHASRKLHALRQHQRTQRTHTGRACVASAPG